MRFRSVFLCVMAMLAVIPAVAGPFVMFPKAQELVSPDGRFIVQNAERDRSGSEFVGTFHSLWLTEVSSTRSRKLLDYVGVAAVAWSGSRFLLVTDYMSKRTSRALVFAPENPEETVVIDVNTVGRAAPELRPMLEGNDHAFVEGTRVEDGVLFLDVWGYGKHDANGFRWKCEYRVGGGSLRCSDARERANRERH